MCVLVLHMGYISVYVQKSGTSSHLIHPCIIYPILLWLLFSLPDAFIYLLILLFFMVSDIASSIELCNKP